jgi:hypothetical protein
MTPAGRIKTFFLNDVLRTELGKAEALRGVALPHGHRQGAVGQADGSHGLPLPPLAGQVGELDLGEPVPDQPGGPFERHFEPLFKRIPLAQGGHGLTADGAFHGLHEFQEGNLPRRPGQAAAAVRA